MFGFKKRLEERQREEREAAEKETARRNANEEIKRSIQIGEFAESRLRKDARCIQASDDALIQCAASRSVQAIACAMIPSMPLAEPSVIASRSFAIAEELARMDIARMRDAREKSWKATQVAIEEANAEFEAQERAQASEVSP